MSASIKLKQLNHYNIRVSGPLFDEVRDFYVNVIGLTEGWAPGPFEFPVVWLYLGDQPVLHLNDRPFDTSTPPPESRSTGWLDHIAFTCSDSASAMVRLDQLNIPYVHNVFEKFGIVQFLLRDPVGIQIELNFSGEDV